jgi:hypothetical protein
MVRDSVIGLVFGASVFGIISLGIYMPKPHYETYEEALERDKKLGFIEGKVVEEVVSRDEYDNKYILGLLAEDGTRYAVEVEDSKKITKEGLNALIYVGDTVRFKAGSVRDYDEYQEDPRGIRYNETAFLDGVTIGTKRADRIQLVNQSTKVEVDQFRY